MTNAFFDEIKKYSAGFSLTSEKIDLSHTIISDLSPEVGIHSEFILSTNSRIIHLGIFLTLLFAALLVFVGRAYYLSVLNKDYYLSISQDNRIREVPVLPERGVIYDRVGNVLVRNKPAFSLVLDTKLCLASCKDVVNQIAKKFGDKIDLNRVIKLIEQENASIILSSSLQRDDILSIEARLKDYPGLSIITSSQRDYLYKDIFSHVLGYVGLDNTITGKSGVEQSYDSAISGTMGNKIIQTDSLGQETKILSQKNSFPGKDLTLYIDSNLQTAAYGLLKKEIDAKKAIAGTVVAQDPHTGGILALVNYPAFDPQKLTDGISQADYAKLVNDPAFPFYNRAISATYPPGSVFKLVGASALLMENIVTPTYQIFDPGFIQVGPYVYHNWKLDGHGLVDITRALQVSNDTFFYKTVGGYENLKGLGIKKLYTWATKFGFGTKTGIDIPSEVPGFFPDGEYKKWYLGDTYITAIGQGDSLATPLQVNNMVSYFANGGHLLAPHVVKSINGVSDTPIKILAENITDQTTYDTIREGLRQVVSPGGTAFPFFDFPQKHNGMRVAGKTGTSEYTDKNGVAKTHAWFSVFGPFDGDAQIVLTVFLEGGGAGSYDAAPIARELFDEFFKESKGL